MQPSTVLYLAANPVRVQALQLGEECRAIEDKIRAARFRDQIRFCSRWAARPDDLLQALNEHTPSVLHFSGHGAGAQGLCFQSDDGSARMVSAGGLAQVMQAAGASVTVVVLNACYSEVQAQALVAHVPCVIGMSEMIGDEEAIIYAASFYRALAFGKSVANAHQQGLAALALHLNNGQIPDIGLPETVLCAPAPRLLSRSDIDANCVYLVHERREKTRCVLVIKATLEEFNADVIARVTEELRKWTGDVSLQITDVDEGSVRLKLSLTPAAAMRLIELKANGQLNQICGFEVADIEWQPAATKLQVAEDVAERLTTKQPATLGGTGQEHRAHDLRAGWGVLKVKHDAGVAERFVIEQLAGFGGMGQVYRARDRVSGGLVALKVMHDAEQLEIERFAREAQVLATLSHPGIVRYIDSGITAEGEPYLAMEWLSGETLAARLQRTQLTLAEALALGRRVASALDAIYRRGVVHRDIKPSNLFLRGSAIDKVALIDFGMARRPLADPKLTVTGTMLGTPGYIAPEQVYNVPNLDGRADIFSLGCVLYRCLSGRAPFRGPDALRMLLNGTPAMLPRLREHRPSIPSELDDLVARMLSRAPEDRPPTGDVVAAELLAIEENEPGPAVTGAGPRRVVSEILATERRLMCLVLARLLVRAEPARPVEEREAQERALYEVVERHRGKLEILADGSLLVILSNADAATDLAARAARCALALQGLLGSGSVVVVSGREVLGPGLHASELLDRAVDLLETTARWATIRIDELTSALLKNRFDTGRTGRHLRGELREHNPMRLVFGEPVACVGREQELDQLETIYNQCTEEHVAGMVLLSGLDGVGKSRLGHEFLARLAGRGQVVEIWLGEADPLNASPAFGLLGQVLRRALRLVDDEPIEARRDKIRAWVQRHPSAGGRRLTEVLGTLVGTPFETDDNPELGSGRTDPRLPSEEMGQAFLSFLRAECAAQPVVIVLEDLHWGDLPTIKLIYAALGVLSDQPLLVLALARTNIHELFPQLWADRCVQEIRLGKLSRKVSAQLVRDALGGAVADDTIKTLVKRSDRHASYLGELIRAAAGGKGATTPQAVLAMVQARIEKLDPAARRVLRAASIFGETFWRGGVEALLGGGDTAAWLAVLAEQGVVEVRSDGRFPAEVEYHFQHALVREAAYEMLTDDDLVTGHWLAGRWLEQVGESDPKIIEAHFVRCEIGRKPGSRP